MTALIIVSNQWIMGAVYPILEDGSSSLASFHPATHGQAPDFLGLHHYIEVLMGPGQQKDMSTA